MPRGSGGRASRRPATTQAQVVLAGDVAALVGGVEGAEGEVGGRGHGGLRLVPGRGVPGSIRKERSASWPRRILAGPRDTLAERNGHQRLTPPPPRRRR